MDKNRRQIVPTHYRNVAEYERGRAEEGQRADAQKELLRDFSIAVMKLRKSAADRPRRTYRGVYTHACISADEISQYFAATLVEENDDFKPCVVKKVAKERLTTQLAKRSVAIEYLVTSYHRSAFIVRSLHFHEDYSSLCLYFDLAAHLPLAIFTHSPPHYAYFRADIEPHVRFVVAAVVLALADLHALQVVYRAINNDNIVIRENGYPLLTNLAHLHPEGRLPAAPPPASPFLSPEELNAHPLTRAADFWALGVLIFHMITGNYPNSANYREDEFNPFGISPQLADLVNRLLRFDPRARLGVARMDDLKGHAFFYGFDWQSFANQALPSPFSSGRSGYPRRDPVEQQYDYHEKENFDSGYSYGGTMMAGLLFLELGSLFAISSLYEREHLYDGPALNEEPPLAQMPSNEFQEGVTFELSDGSNDAPEDGGFD